MRGQHQIEKRSRAPSFAYSTTKHLPTLSIANALAGGCKHGSSMTGLSNSALLRLCTEQELEVRPWIEPEARESTSVDASVPNQDNSLYYLAKTVLRRPLMIRSGGL